MIVALKKLTLIVAIVTIGIVLIYAKNSKITKVVYQSKVTKFNRLRIHIISIKCTLTKFYRQKESNRKSDFYQCNVFGFWNVKI